MTLLAIVKYPSPVLKKKAKAILQVTPDIVRLMNDMAETMYANNGVGLAAPQIGTSKRVITVDIGIELPDGTKKSNLMQIANPEIIAEEGEIEWEEGCLSIPNFTMKMSRKSEVVVQGLNRSNKKVELIAEGLLAVVFQHEIDHLNGKLLIDNVSSLKRELYVKEMKKKG